MKEKVKIIEKVRSFEDACNELGLDANALPDVEHLPEKDRKSIIAYCKLIIIIRALNEGWEPDFIDWNQYKYWNWFYMGNGASAGFVNASANNAASASSTAVSSRLCFKTRELATYAREQFRDLYFEYLFIEMPKNYGK
jgi:hypothetical protein